VRAPVRAQESIVQSLKLKHADGLRDVVFRNDEIFLGQPFNRLSVLILDQYGLDDQLSLDTNREGLLLLCLRGWKNQGHKG
jgi:hypothetical protein